ncbi:MULTISPECIES: acyl-CoA thioesterase [Prauserella salsuginis group]|uniref:Acyl-CoA thioester hydrolase n=2 Tax=Prauserella salsuginis group TaxID=2893672 RepID=A0A839XUX6_9PSEU|nr:MULTISPECIES: hotdog domain-containing protein [Prauserella salsuginis group]MBB3665194.1 acyl-CoA thioester hydrolase [Prauserella sediminis]MCR3718658.1 acyl-CoA thioester hydrolase [Prauserella flava]MCR3733228.1 acyl-CoA thioester hydrolase [Prauserella salsuginis]
MSDRDRLTFQLSYGDCDAMGIAYFAIYYRWMERTYTTWLYSHGLRSGDLEPDLGVVTVGVSSGATYHRTAQVFDELVCQAVLDRVGTSSYTVGYEFTCEGDLVTRGQMTYACRDETFAKTAVPDRLAGILRTLPSPRFDVP